MKENNTKKVAYLYGIFLGIFGVHDFYLNRNRQGIIHFLLTIVPFYFYLLLSNEIRSELSEKELVGNLYVPTLTGDHLLLYRALNVIMLLAFIGNIIWLIIEIIRLFHDKLTIPKDNKPTVLRFMLLALVLGWTGVHNAIAGHFDKAKSHLILTLVSVFLIVIGIRPYSTVPSVPMVVGIGILALNEINAIIEGSRAFWYNRIKK